MVGKNLRTLLVKKYQSADLKSHGIGLGYLIYVKNFVKFCFLCGYLYKELQAGINDLDISIEQKTFF